MNENIKENVETEIDLLALMVEVLRHWKIIFLATLVLAMGSFAYSRYMITPMYSSMARLYVFSKSTSITSLADIQMGSSLTNDYVKVPKMRPVLDRVILDLNLDETYKSLDSKVEVSNPSNTRYLEIKVTDPDPERAKAIADDLADVSARFIAEKMDQDPPSVLQYGYSDEGPVSPSIPRNTVIGGFVGALISVAMVVLFYFFNNTIESPEDVETKLGLKLIAQIPLERDAIEYYDEKHEKKMRKKEKKARRAKK